MCLARLGFLELPSRGLFFVVRSWSVNIEFLVWLFGLWGILRVLVSSCKLKPKAVWTFQLCQWQPLQLHWALFLLSISSGHKENFWNFLQFFAIFLFFWHKSNQLLAGHLYGASSSSWLKIEFCVNFIVPELDSNRFYCMRLQLLHTRLENIYDGAISSRDFEAKHKKNEKCNKYIAKAFECGTVLFIFRIALLEYLLDAFCLWPNGIYMAFHCTQFQPMGFI